MDWNVIGVYVAAIAFIIPFLILASNWFIEYTGIKSNKRRRDEANERFDRIVGNLSTDNTAAQLSAAVLLRRFFALRIGFQEFNNNNNNISTINYEAVEKTSAHIVRVADDCERNVMQQ